MTTHPIIDRLAEISSEELTINDVSYVLGQGRKTVERYLRMHKIEALEAAAHRSQTEQHHRYRIATAAILVFLIRNTGGDKAVLMEAVRLRFPHHHKFCERLLNAATHALPGAVTEIPPRNFIPMTATRSPRLSRPSADHPDQLHLFSA